MPQSLNLVVEVLTELSRGVIAKEMELVKVCGLALAVHGKNTSLESAMRWAHIGPAESRHTFYAATGVS